MTNEEKRISLREELGQNWTYNSYSCMYTDQFGFRIVVTGDRYNAYHMEAFCGYYLMLETAKEICKIVLNDRILGKAKKM